MFHEKLGRPAEKDRREIERQMRDDVLEISRYPEIVYEFSRFSASKIAEGQYQLTLNGDLTLYGITRNRPVSARVTVSGETLVGFGDFSLDQSDYEIKLVFGTGWHSEGKGRSERLVQPRRSQAGLKGVNADDQNQGSLGGSSSADLLHEPDRKCRHRNLHQ